jgi:hypothetical protein
MAINQSELITTNPRKIVEKEVKTQEALSVGQAQKATKNSSKHFIPDGWKRQLVRFRFSWSIYIFLLLICHVAVFVSDF